MSAKLEVATEVFHGITLCWLFSSLTRFEGGFYVLLQYNPRIFLGLPCRWGIMLPPKGLFIDCHEDGGIHLLRNIDMHRPTPCLIKQILNLEQEYCSVIYVQICIAIPLLIPT